MWHLTSRLEHLVGGHHRTILLVDIVDGVVGKAGRTTLVKARRARSQAT
jgi:hypothetical protein